MLTLKPCVAVHQYPGVTDDKPPSHIVLRISHELQLSTKTSKAAKLRLKMKKTTCASMVELLMRNWSGGSRGTLPRGGNQRERTWTPSRLPTIQLVALLPEGSSARVRTC